MDEDRLITIAIYTYEKAQIIKGILENEDIPVAIQNVNLIQPVISSGVRVRIRRRFASRLADFGTIFYF